MNVNLSQQSINIIKDSALLITANATQITSTMYTMLFEKHPHFEELFKDAPDNQYMILAEALSAYAVNIDNLQRLQPALKVIAVAHVKADIQAFHYPMLGIIFIQALEQSLGDKATIEFIDAWREAYKHISNILIDLEKGLYTTKKLYL